MALSTDILLGVPYNVGGTLREVDASTVVDNVFTFSSNGKVWQRVFDGGNSVYRASWLNITGAPTNKSALMAIIIANAAIQTIEIDTDVNLGTTNVNFQGKRLQFKNGGTISGTSATINNAIISADYSNNIINTGVSVTSSLPADGKWSVKWFGAVGDGVTDDVAKLTRTAIIAAATTAKTIVLPYGNYLISASGFAASGCGVQFEFGAMISGSNFVTNIYGIYASAHQQIFATTIQIFNVFTDGYFSVKWTGAKGDGVTDDRDAFAACNTSTNIECRSILIPRSSGKYILNTNLIINPASSGTAERRTWKFETGAQLGGTANITGAIIEASKHAKIADTTITFLNSNPSDGLWSVRWQADELGITNYTTAFTKAITACNQRYTVYVPTGTWPIDGPILNCPLMGEGRGTILTYATGGTTGAILQVGRHTLGGDTGLLPISSFQIDGNADSSVTASGIRFDPADIYAGRWQFNNIIFQDCKISVEKTGGNFGNQFNGCSFNGVNNTDFHMYAVDVVAMHAGLDVFNSCRFLKANLAAIYKRDEEGGGDAFNSCVFEYNRGFDVFYEASGVNHDIVPVVFNGCWLEGDLKSFPVTINSVVYNDPYEFWFNKCNSVEVNQCTLGRMQLSNNTHVRINGGATAYNYGQKPTTVDSTSYLEITGSISGFTQSPNAYYLENGIRYQPKGAGYSKTIFPSIVSNSYQNNLILSFDFTNPALASYSIGLTSAVSTEGVLLKQCSQYSNADAGSTLTNLSFTTVLDKWYVSSLGFRWVSGTRVRVTQTGAQSGLAIDTTYGSAMGQWEYWYSIRKATAATGVGFQITSDTTADAVFNLSCYQVLQFDTYMQAVEFIKRMVYVNANAANNNNYVLRGSMTAATAVTIPSGAAVTSIVLDSSTTQTNLLIGTTPGGSDLGSTSFTGGLGDVIQVGMYGTGSNSVNFSDVSGTVNYRINLEY